MIKQKLGLYVHIPFCSRICHYCDFAKTANFTDDHVAIYLEAIYKQLTAWALTMSDQQKFTSVFFGGGTPGLLSREYEKLMELIHTLTKSGAEITLESNPANVTRERVAVWRSLGFNRLSIGVQSFDPHGLKALTRDHSSKQARDALELAVATFPKTNGDLIYGWPGQSMDSWQSDVEGMIEVGINHLSLYALTLEGQTPFARAQRRGALEAISDDELAGFYERACEILASHGFGHEEVSNWSRLGGRCEHNWLYWQADKFIGIGAGAHGYVDDGSNIGLRYSYPGDLRAFLRVAGQGILEKKVTVESIILGTGGQIDRDRDLNSWLLEYVGCALRSEDGLDLQRLKNNGFKFQPNAKVLRALAEGRLLHSGDRLKALESEWFRETSWSFELCESLVVSGGAS